MKNPTTQPLFYTFFAVLLLHYAAFARCQEVEDEGEFSYDENSVNGPQNWGNIHPEWFLCGNGTMQSPIDLLDNRVKIVPRLGMLNRDYKPSNATLINRGHDIMLRWEGDAGHLQINDTKYQLVQCHWHSPSEHAINGKRFDLEAHLVHQSPDGKVAVIGIIYKIGRPDSFLSSIQDSIEALADTSNKSVGIIDPKKIKIGSKKYYRYMGSLTTPPCTEGVVWTVIKKVSTVSKEQVNLLRTAVHDASATNARPLQPINNRPLLFYKPRFRCEEY